MEPLNFKFGGGSDATLLHPLVLVAIVIAGALMVTALAFLVEGLFAVIQRILTPRALRHEEGAADLIAPLIVEGT